MWSQSAERFASQVAGPHFEVICREYLLDAGRSLVGDLGTVGAGVVVDPAGRKQIEIDVVAMNREHGSAPSNVLLLGEAKWGSVMGINHLDRLARARDVLGGRGLGTADCRLACFSAKGFSDALRTESSKRSDVLLLSLDDLYI